MTRAIEVEIESPDGTQCVDADALAFECFRGCESLVTANGVHTSADPPNGQPLPAGLCECTPSSAKPPSLDLKYNEGTTPEQAEGAEGRGPSVSTAESEGICHQEMTSHKQAIVREGTTPRRGSGVSSDDVRRVWQPEKNLFTPKTGVTCERVINVPRLAIDECADSVGGSLSRRSNIQRAADVSQSMVAPAELSPHEVIYLKLLYYYKRKSRSARENLWGPSDLCWHCCRRPSVTDTMTKSLIQVLKGRADAPAQHAERSFESEKPRC
ncbi:hypothetical protein BESB_085340 [Besnoitia besnoiti]|uniref:Uncharacterized protein n=1 Tax=Besnoitia besnoiti TaxID=94643 RepID=A0A2A9M5V7_BESBE|nr:hypothetical protein BESB_085340 [Besnoitia besnoiti]PFH33335.1 hypothetical protein BESB_085340 [Besnoitia besnoiti]